MWAGTLECRSSFTKAKLTLSHLQCIRLWMNTTSTFPPNIRFSLRQIYNIHRPNWLAVFYRGRLKGVLYNHRWNRGHMKDIKLSLSNATWRLPNSPFIQSYPKQIETVIVYLWVRFNQHFLHPGLGWDSQGRCLFPQCFRARNKHVGVLLPAHTKTTHKCNCWLEGSLQSYLHWVSNTVLLPEKNIARELKKLPTSLNSFRGAAGIRSSSK